MLPLVGTRRMRAGAATGRKHSLAEAWRWMAAACTLAIAVSSQARPLDPAPRMAAWRFQEDFSHGIPAWMSYPLAQDVGYDPSLYTARVGGNPVLERDVIANGERRLHVGLLRPVRFHASRASRIQFRWELTSGGAVAGFALTLGATDGKRYTAQLPIRTGEQFADVSGSELGLGPAGADIDVVVIEAIVRRPALGSHNRLTLSSFALDAERIPEIAVEAPRLFSSATGEQVAAEAVMAGSPLTLRTAAASGASTALLFAPDGSRIASVPLKAGRSTPVELGREPGLWRIAISGAGGRNEFKVLVLGPTPPHPRVLFGTKRLEQLRSDAALQPVREMIHQEAGKLAAAIAFNPAAGENITLLSPDSVFPGLVPYFTLMDSYANAIGYNALDYRLNGNAVALDVARRGLLAVAAWPTWTPPWFTAHGLHTYYEAGIFTQRAAFGYDLIAGDLSAEDRTRIAGAFWRNAIAPAVQEYFVNERLPIAASNHMAHTIGGALAAAVATAGDVPDWQTRFAPAAGELMIAYAALLRDLFPGDGSEAEPAGYENFAMQGISWGAAAMDSFAIHSQGLDAMLAAFWWLKYIEVRPQLALDTGDFDGTMRSLPGFAWPAEHSGTPALRQLYEQSSHALDRLAKVQDPGPALETDPIFLDLACCSRPAAAAAMAPPSRLFAARGSAVLRSGWNADDTVISLRAGPWFNHEHHDQGSFQAAAFGEPLIAEAGYSNYYTDPRYADYFTQAPGHNTVVVDDDAFSQQASEGDYWRSLHRHARFAAHVFSPNLDYIRADLGAAYDGTLSNFTREYVFIKPDVLIVRDQIAASQEHRFTWLLHVPETAKAKFDGASARIEGNRAAALLTAAEGQWDERPTPIPITAYADMDRQQVQPRSVLRLTSPARRTAGFLVGIRFARAGEAATAPEKRSVANGEGFTLHSSAGTTELMFRTATGRLSAGGYSTDGNAIAATRRGDAETVFATSARELRRAGTPILTASAPIDVSDSSSDAGREIDISCGKGAAIRIFPGEQPRGVLLDGKAIPFTGNSITVNLTPGQHVIRIRR